MIKELKKNKVFLSCIVIIIFRFGNFIWYKVKVPVIRQCMYLLYKIADFVILRMLLNSEIPARTKIGRGLVIFHPYGIIINADSILGEGITIRHQVTIGNNGVTNECPVIGNFVNIGAGAKIIGGIRIQDNSFVGANAVVVSTFDKSGSIVGVPAQLKKGKS